MKTSTLVSLLSGDSSITALLSAPTAISEQALPRGFALPAIVVHRYNGGQDQAFDGPSGVREDNFQIDVYGLTADQCDAITDACRVLLTGYSGTLSDGTAVQGCYLEQDRDMPFLPNADIKSLAFRSLLGFRFVTGV